MNVQPHERVLRAFREGQRNTVIADVVVQLAELRELSHNDVVRLERWTQAPPSSGTPLELWLDNELVARGTFVEVAGHRAIRLTNVVQR